MHSDLLCCQPSTVLSTMGKCPASGVYSESRCITKFLILVAITGWHLLTRFHPLLQKRLFKAKVFRRQGMIHHDFRFNEVASKVMDWNPEHSDVLENVVTDSNLLRCDETESYRGSKQKSPAFMETMIEICTSKGGAVLDLTAGVGECIFPFSF